MLTIVVRCSPVVCDPDVAPMWPHGPEPRALLIVRVRHEHAEDLSLVVARSRLKQPGEPLE